MPNTEAQGRELLGSGKIHAVTVQVRGIHLWAGTSLWSFYKNRFFGGHQAPAKLQLQRVKQFEREQMCENILLKGIFFQLEPFSQLTDLCPKTRKITSLREDIFSWVPTNLVVYADFKIVNIPLWQNASKKGNTKSSCYSKNLAKFQMFQYYVTKVFSCLA